MGDAGSLRCVFGRRREMEKWREGRREVGRARNNRNNKNNDMEKKKKRERERWIEREINRQ